MDTPPTMSQFASREACLVARDKWFQEKLEAAKQQNLELLAVIEKQRNAIVLALNKVTCDPSLQIVATLEDALEYEPSEALREHEAKVLETAADYFDDQEYLSVSKHLRRMAEERRKK